MIVSMFRYAFVLAASAVADAPKAAVPIFLAPVDGARS
jgi:flavoprotein